MKKGSRSKKAVRRKMMLGTILCIAALCAGCGKKASEEAAQTQVPTTQETTTQAATSAPEILIQSDEEQKEETKDLPDYNLPEEAGRKRRHDPKLPYRSDGTGRTGKPPSYRYHDEQ